LHINKIFKISAVIIISIIISSGFSNLVFGKTIDSPREQLERGIAPKEVVCKSSLVLVIFNNAPLCLKPTTISKLEQRGNALIVVTGSVSQENTIDTDLQKFTNKSKSSVTVQGNSGNSETLIQIAPASSGGKVNFYLNDDDLNTSPKGIDLLPTRGLLEFTINGVPIKGPPTIQETGVDTGRFFVSVTLPETIDGKPLQQDDVLEIKYFDQTDVAGEKRINITSIPLTRAYANIQTSGGGNRIGHDFVVRIYEPDLNLDSKNTDTIPLSKVEFRSEGGIRTTLANSAFSANSRYLLETGVDTGFFEVIIKIPRTIDGKTINIGDEYEIRYIDTSTPSDTDEKVKLEGKIG
jgi:hypothetical protein